MEKNYYFVEFENILIHLTKKIKKTIQKTTKTPKVRWSSWPQFQPEYLHVRARIEGMDISEVAGTVAARMGSVNEVRLI